MSIALEVFLSTIKQGGGGGEPQQGEKKAEHSSILFKKNTLSFLLSMPRWPSITKKIIYYLL